MTDHARPPRCAAHDRNPRKPGTEAPPGACDTHAHVFGPGDQYPFIPHGLYTPADALTVDYAHMLDVLGMERGVLVQPSVYGTHNQAMLDAMAGKPNLRGIAVVPYDVVVADIERLHGLGVRGVRCNIVDVKFGKGALPLDQLKPLAARIKPFGRHIEILMHVNEFPDLDRQLADFPVDVVFGHLGYVPTSQGTETAGFKGLLRLMRDGKAWVKLTAPYRLTLSEMPYPDVDATARILVDQAADRLLWGSDWPHTFIKTGMPNDGDLFDLFTRWVPDEAMRARILVTNPQKLYDFPAV
jgi:2-pyrone-4,6-dicarboxylate lactonase